MAGVAQQHDVAVDPALERLAIDQHPLVDLGTGGEHALHVGMETLERRAQDLDVALFRP